MITRTPGQVTYTGWDCPDVEVRRQADDTWHPGSLRSWIRNDDGSWRALVEWSPEPGSTYLDDFTEADVRPDARPVRPAP